MFGFLHLERVHDVPRGFAPDRGVVPRTVANKVNQLAVHVFARVFVAGRSGSDRFHALALAFRDDTVCIDRERFALLRTTQMLADGVLEVVLKTDLGPSVERIRHGRRLAHLTIDGNGTAKKRGTQ